MCYSGQCQYELPWSGDCNKSENVPCPEDEQPDEEEYIVPDIDEHIFI